jgi:hypothetical protein
VQGKTQRRVVSAFATTGFLYVILVVCSLPVLGSAEPNNRVICSEKLSLSRREILTDKLREITGLQIRFAENGALRLTPSVAQHGSQTARDLISKALRGTNVIVLEDASDRFDVVFSRVVFAEWKQRGPDLPPAFVVLIDFTDFEHLLGDREALRAFDVGWAFLHELDHVVNDSADTHAENEPGDCEDHINVMRKECDLPSRAEYFFKLLPNSHGDFRTRFVRLPFDQTETTTNKRRRYWVMWDAALVGGLAAEIAIAR